MIENLTQTPRHGSQRPARAGRRRRTWLALASILLTLATGSACDDPKPAKFKDLVPSEPPPSSVEVKPHPLMLVVEIESGGGLKLNGKGIGKVDDTAELSQKLKEIFAERRRDHAYAPGMENRTDLTEEERIAKAVFIKAPRSMKYIEVVKVIDAIKGASGNPIGIQIDDAMDASPTPPQ